MLHAPRLPDADIAALSLRHLESVVRVDSQSDEASTTIPTTEGQRVLADQLAGFYAGLGATVERDGSANVIATFPGRGAGAGRAPVALLVHLDTARGTRSVDHLFVRRAWDGGRLPFPANATIRVDTTTYPGLQGFVGQDLVHGPGDVPFGLDDKLGLSHLMTLATLLAGAPEAAHPPLLFVGRPDEEVGRHEAVVRLAALFAERGVTLGYTIDGILPFEVNVENFNAAMASVSFPSHVARRLHGPSWTAHLGGVNTHGATARREGHRAAPRLTAEWQAALDPADAVFVGFVSDALRDCDAIVQLRIAPGAEERVRAALAAVMQPHVDRGASWSLIPTPSTTDEGAVEDMLHWLRRFYTSQPGFVLPAEDSEGREGYSQPFRARPSDGALRLDVRLRDFDAAVLEQRIAHVRGLADGLGVEVQHQYVNMGPRLAPHPEALELARRAADAVGVPVSVTPIRGGTGVDPFLDKGIPIANLGTGYFAPESEKELTSLQTMVGHVRWLYALVQVLAGADPGKGNPPQSG